MDPATNQQSKLNLTTISNSSNSNNNNQAALNLNLAKNVSFKVDKSLTPKVVNGNSTDNMLAKRDNNKTQTTELFNLEKIIDNISPTRKSVANEPTLYSNKKEYAKLLNAALHGDKDKEKEKVSPGKKHKIIKHLKASPEKTTTIDQEYYEEEEEEFLYKLKSDEELTSLYKDKFNNFKEFKLSKERFELINNYSEKDKIRMIKEYLAQIRLTDLISLKEEIANKIEHFEENSILQYGQKYQIKSDQKVFIQTYKIKKPKVIKVVTQKQISKHKEVTFFSPKRPLNTIAQCISFQITQAYDKNNRLYFPEEMARFKMMKSEVKIIDNKISSFNPPDYNYETENIYKINRKHNKSLFHSEGNFHLNNENSKGGSIFPQNKNSEFKLIDYNERIIKTVNNSTMHSINLHDNSSYIKSNKFEAKMSSLISLKSSFKETKRNLKYLLEKNNQQNTIVNDKNLSLVFKDLLDNKNENKQKYETIANIINIDFNTIEANSPYKKKSHSKNISLHSIKEKEICSANNI